jgi:hypothetical protein
MPFSGQDETIICRDCRTAFVFTIGEQEFYNTKGLADPPKRCAPCRAKKKAEKQGAQETQVAEAAWQDEREQGDSRRSRRR